jgi:hypothetical protein
VQRRGFEGGPPPRRLRHVAIMVTMLIRGATYAKPKAYAEWVGTYPKNKKYILYCA